MKYTMHEVHTMNAQLAEKFDIWCEWDRWRCSTEKFAWQIWGWYIAPTWLACHKKIESNFIIHLQYRSL